MNMKKTSIIFTLSVFALILLSCEKEKAVFFPPELGDLKATEITDSSAIVSCNIVESNEMDIQECGFCYYPKEDSSVVYYTKTPIQKAFSANISGLMPEKEYMVKAYAKNVVGVSYSNIISLKNKHNNDTIQNNDTGTVNGHDWVDLGLPSGTKWATCNIGAVKPEDYGNYYAWCETTAKTTYDWSTYRYCNGSERTLTKYCSNSSYGNNGFTDALITLESSDDAATAKWGSGWRMPTETELNELNNNCTVIWTTQNGVNGLLFTGPNGNSIFLPAAGNRYGSELCGAGSYGYYWSSSLYTSYPVGAWGLYFYSDNYGQYDAPRFGVYYYDRCCGFSVRAVCNHM